MHYACYFNQPSILNYLTLDVECCVHDMDGGGSPSAEQLRVSMSPEFPLMELFQLVISGGTKY